ncbi:MAG TPA: fibrobacter succinogenes major paralogous domain-containing protein [Bacteroidales bacterium]|nr:fibrobacter succinogenes major paralogous domain-containing protein [Bacteroidales bacterium]
MNSRIAALLAVFVFTASFMGGCKNGDPPTLNTYPVTNVTLTSAESGGSITDDGGSGITSRGVCWSDTQEPTTDDNVTSDGTGSGDFVSAITGLTDNTTYYLRAYAVNSEGTAYGELQTFQTLAAGMATVTTAAIQSITPTSFSSGGNVVSDGGKEVTERGICWSTSINPTVDNNKVPGGTGPGEFTCNITDLTNGTVYYVRSYATNSLGTSYGNEISFITPVADVEGNIYKTVKIGNQVWTADNLRTVHLNDNTVIPEVRDSLQWVILTTPAYVWNRNNPANKDVHGALYNWYTVSTGRLCPDGWHIPTNAEFETLERTIGVPADSIAFWGWRGQGTSAKLKDSIGWLTGAGNNSSGFSAKGSGYRAWTNGQFRALGEITYFWTATDDSPNNKPTVAWYRRLDASNQYIYKATTEKEGGKSIRCVKNQ